MPLKLIVKASEQTGLPFIEVPHKNMWELVEYLSMQRPAVKYAYHPNCFTVSFLHLDATTAQRLLDDWNPGECLVSE